MYYDQILLPSRVGFFFIPIRHILVDISLEWMVIVILWDDDDDESWLKIKCKKQWAKFWILKRKKS